MRGFLTLAPELRLQCYHFVLREQPESGATVTVYPTTETYQFSVPKGYQGLLVANKQVYHELMALAAKVYTADDFEADKKLKRPFQVKTIVIDQQVVNIYDPRARRFSLLTGTGISDLFRWSSLSIYLRRVECSVKFFAIDGKHRIGQFSFSWDDEIGYKSEKTTGDEVWALARNELERDVRDAISKPALCDSHRSAKCYCDSWNRVDCKCRDAPSTIVRRLGADTSLSFNQPYYIISKENWELVSHRPMVFAMGRRDGAYKEPKRALRDDGEKKTLKIHCRASHLHRCSTLDLGFASRI